MKLFYKSVKYFKLRALFLFGKIRALFTQKQYCIKRGYRHRCQSIYFDDRALTDEYQDEVYHLARFYSDQYRYKNIADIGCGSGYKLMKYFSEFNTIGIEVSPTYDFLAKEYPGRNWININDLNNRPVAADIIICADVIEHIKDPQEFLQLIKRIKFELLFLSTPERDLIRGAVDYGPPHNAAHLREWNASEFREYISGHFEIISHMVTNIEQSTQLIICRPVNE
jgi:2-polyprenyl-3-methyl-5-hydroxy-6-metoxy-1,4-benzoquinol methylase